MEHLYISRGNMFELDIKNGEITSIYYTGNYDGNVLHFNNFIDNFVKNRDNFVNLKSLYICSEYIRFYDFTYINKLDFLFKDEKIEHIKINNCYEYLEKKRDNIILECLYTEIYNNIHIEINVLNIIYLNEISTIDNEYVVIFELYFTNLPCSLKEINFYVDYDDNNLLDHEKGKITNVHIIIFTKEAKIPFNVDLSLTIRTPYGLDIDKIDYKLDKKLTVYHKSYINEELLKRDNLIFTRLKFL